MVGVKATVVVAMATAIKKFFIFVRTHTYTRKGMHRIHR